MASTRVFKGRHALALGAAALVLALAPRPAQADDPGLACKQISPLIHVQHLFGLAHAEKRKAGSGITQYGRFSSFCDVFVYNHAPATGTTFGGPPNYRIRKGLGFVRVMTATQTDNPAFSGDWDPDAVNHNLLEAADAQIARYGGHDYPIPHWDFSDSYAFWSGSEDRHAFAFWRDGEDGFIEFDVTAHHHAQELLKALGIAYANAGFAPSARFR